MLDAPGLVRDGGVAVALTPRERALLEYLALRKGEFASRIEIEDALYTEHTLPEGNAVQTLVSRLRAKLDQVSDGPRIETLRGRGYRLTVPRP